MRWIVIKYGDRIINVNVYKIVLLDLRTYPESQYNKLIIKGGNWESTIEGEYAKTAHQQLVEEIERNEKLKD